MKKNVRKKKKKEKNVEIVVRKEIRKLVFKATKLISSLINKTLIEKVPIILINPMLDVNQDLPHVEIDVVF